MKATSGRVWKINQRTGVWYTEGASLEPTKEGWTLVKVRIPNDLRVPTGEHNAAKAFEVAEKYFPREEDW